MKTKVKSDPFSNGYFEFEGRKWLRHVLNREVLIVATFTCGANWKAYVGVVPGRNHDRESLDVLRTGDRLDERLARFLFPEFAEFAYDR
jgi:hypothetical protein